MNAASSGSQRFRSLASVLGALVLGATGLAIVLFLLSSASVSAGMPNAVPPIPVRIRPSDGHYTRTTSIEFAWNDVGVPTYTLLLDGQVYTLTTTSVVRTLPEGVHQWAVQAINVAKEASGYATLWSLTIDTTPPAVPTLNTPPNNTRTASREIDFTWNGVQGATAYDLRVDGQVYRTSATSLLLTLPVDKGYTWAVRSVDSIGNPSAYSAEWTVIVDTTPPDVPLLSFPTNGSAGKDANVSFVWSDVGAATYDLLVVGVAPVRAPYAATISGDTTHSTILQDGVYTWTVRSRDALGNASAYAAPWSFTVDTIPPPKPTLIAPPNETRLRSPEVNFDWSDVAGARFDLAVNDVPVLSNLPWSLATVSLADGSHTWKVRSVDAVGNKSGYTDPWLVTVDTISPALTILAPTPAQNVTTTNMPTLVIRGTAADAGTGLERVEVNVGSGWQPAVGTISWSYGWALPTWDKQARNIRVRAWDRSGNSTEQSVAVWIDTKAPTTYDVVHNQNTYVNGPVVYSWSVWPDAAGIRDYEIKIENNAGYHLVQPTLNPTFTFAGATQENKLYYAWVRTRDLLGNWGAWSTSSPVVIPDLSPPTIQYPEIRVQSTKLRAIGTQLYYTGSISVPQLVEVRGHSSDLVSDPARVEFSRAFGDKPSDETTNFAPWSSARPPLYGYHVDPGESSSGEIVATVYDRAGNSATQVFAYEPDGTPPQSRAAAPAYATGAPIYITWEATDTQCGVGQVKLYYRNAQSGGWQPAPEPGGSGSGERGTFIFVPMYGDGLYEFATRATDILGNLETGAFVAQTSTIYDTTKPSSEVTWTPEFRRGNTITGTWEATPSQAPITTVDLWVLPDNGVQPNVWARVKTVGTGGATSGSFTYDVLRDGTYYFSTVAFDAAGKREPDPQGYGDAHTIRDSRVGVPGSVMVSPPDWAFVNSFDVLWTNPPGELSGIAAAHYQLVPESGAPLVPIRVPGDDLDEIERITVPQEGRYTLKMGLEDYAGNVGPLEFAVPQTVLKFDASIAAPISLTVQPDGWSATNLFGVNWTNPQDVSGIVGAYYKLDERPFWETDGTWVYGEGLNRIEGITLPNEGSHTLYVWLQDEAGNADHLKWASVSLRYDNSPPEDVSVIAPSFSPLVRFEVSWAASDFHAGVISYSVEVSGWPTYEWQPWIDSTTDESAIFKAPVADDVYDFRVTAYDQAGKSASDEARTQVDVQRAYLPFGVVRSKWLPWHQQDRYEENNTEADAYGPLVSLEFYSSVIWDQTDPTDFYYFEPTATDEVIVTLDGMRTGVDLDLIVWRYSEASKKYILVDWDGEYGNRPEEVVFTPVAGSRYWIEVRPYKIIRSSSPDWKPNSNAYTLRVIYR